MPVLYIPIVENQFSKNYTFKSPVYFDHNGFLAPFKDASLCESMKITSIIALQIFYLIVFFI